MSEQDTKNKEAYVSLIEKCWGFNDKSLDYIKKRVEDDWKLVPEFQSYYEANNGENQRVRFSVDMGNPRLQKEFESTDEAWKIFRQKFDNCLDFLKRNEECEVTYSDFLANTVTYKKNKTKIKKIIEKIYIENIQLYSMDSGNSTNRLSNEEIKAKITNYILKSYEYIGTFKKSAKKLQVVISWNPCDWLLSSTSEEFTSCFDLDKKDGSSGYQYCTGLPFLCGDRNRAMIYITDGTQKEFEGISVDSVKARSWVILDKENCWMVVKWYPNKLFDISALSEILRLPQLKEYNSNFLGGKYELDVLSLKSGMVVSVYNDMGSWEMQGKHLFHKGGEKSGQQLFTDAGTKLTGGRGHRGTVGGFDGRFDNFSRITGMSKAYRPKVWKQYGFKLDDLWQKARCNSCNQETGGFIVQNNKGADTFVCKDCYVEKTKVCENCGDYKFSETGDFGTFKNIKTTNGIKLFCNNCYDSVKSKICTICGCYEQDSEKRHKVNNENLTICSSCLSDLEKSPYRVCSNCHHIIKDFTIKLDSFSRKTVVICEDCKNDVSISSLNVGNSTFGRTFKLFTKVVHNPINIE